MQKESLRCFCLPAIVASVVLNRIILGKLAKIRICKELLDFFGGASLGKLCGWVFSYPHIQPYSKAFSSDSSNTQLAAWGHLHHKSRKCKVSGSDYFHFSRSIFIE